ncbi:MAG: hypothetical protein Ct9H90mP16_01730 [Candidatus Poseidoniales archaeon]|nr:MAG: hypothetical protein Ct9H90mP16_01730 [Candidatus Poseidoniales archaeon]
MPVLIEMESGKGMTGTWLSNQPCLVSENPRSIDLVRIDKTNLAIADQLLTDAAGMVLDLDGMPPLHDGEVLALMTGLRTHLGSEKPLILAGRIDRVSNLHRMLRDQPFDGVLVRLVSRALGMAAPAALPRLDCQREMQAFRGNCISLMSHGKRDPTMRRFRPLGLGIIQINPFAGEEEKPQHSEGSCCAIEGWLAQFSAEFEGECPTWASMPSSDLIAKTCAPLKQIQRPKAVYAWLDTTARFHNGWDSEEIPCQPLLSNLCHVTHDSGQARCQA